MKKNNFMTIIVMLFLVAIILLNIFTLSTAKKSLDFKVLQAGGKENAQKLEELLTSDKYKQKQKTEIEAALEMFKQGSDQNPVDTTTVAEKNNVVSDNSEAVIAKLVEIKQNAVIEGDENARFTILEYSELLCTFCQRHKIDNTLRKVIESHPDQVNVVMRHYIVHSPAKKLAEGIECARDAGASNKKYLELIKEAFVVGPSNISESKLKDLAKDLGIGDIGACIDSGKYSDAIDAQTAEGKSLFGVTGTPGNVIIDSETGEYILIPGAYPSSKFIEEIDKRLEA